ncbi:MAG: glycosyltransferase family 4 protein, partial [Chitinophagales bacterium]|nr:glycosyltransferase family 4 protein [Chitinophagales bacterium]
YGGAEKSIIEIASRFKKFSPVIFQLYSGDDLVRYCSKRNVSLIQLELNKSYNFNKAADVVISELKLLNPVLIHSTLFDSDMVARIAARKLKLPLVASFVNNSYSKARYQKLDLTGKMKLLAIQLWDAWSARNVTHFIANSNTIRQSNSRALQVPLNKITVIFRGRDKNEFKDVGLQEILKMKQTLGINPGAKVFLNVGRLIERKGQLELIEAFCLLNKCYPSTMLLIAGDGPLRPVLESLIKERNMASSIKLLGSRSDVPMLLKIADFFVFPSWYEGLPGSVIEAMFSQTPIILSDIPENRECVTDDMALFFPAGDVEKLAEKMGEALELSDWPLRTGKAYARALEHFDIDKVAAQYEELYERLLKKN